MLPVRRLSHLHPNHRLRKAALLATEAEALVRGSDPAGVGPARAYEGDLAAFFAADGEAPLEVQTLARDFLSAPDLDRDRAFNRFRHGLVRLSGQAPADWDLLPPRGSETSEAGGPSRRPGLRVYLEDIRSPFNVGSMLRTSDAFGVEEVLLSPECADPGHPRASRSSMGAVSLVSWRRAGLEALEAAARAGEGVFALELGGSPVREFAFPPRGIAILGSEELGVSLPALDLARSSAGVVSIPMAGSKASLNVGVAYGILMEAWAARRPGA